LSHTQSPFVFVFCFLWKGLINFAWAGPWTHDLPASASWVAGITSVCHHAHGKYLLLVLLIFLLLISCLVLLIFAQVFVTSFLLLTLELLLLFLVFSFFFTV
jgi:hypothetical protein